MFYSNLKLWISFNEHELFELPEFVLEPQTKILVTKVRGLALSEIQVEIL